MNHQCFKHGYQRGLVKETDSESKLKGLGHAILGNFV